MAESLRALLRDSIDYAGMFPPASLSLGQAWRNYAGYRRQPEAWMLGRMVCPAPRLAELAALDEMDPPSLPTPREREPAVSVLLTGGETSDAWRQSVERELGVVRQFQQALRIDSLEVRLPADAAGQGSRSAWERLLDALNESETSGVWQFLELPGEVAQNGDAAFRQLVDFLGDVQKQRPKGGRKLGFKLRTGGVKPQAFLSSAQLASVICALRDARVPWKATAGLHHPLPAVDAQSGVRMQGFVNLLTAAAIADVLEAPQVDVQNILEDDDPRNFQFAGPSLAWEGLSIETPQIEQSRRRSFLSFGSCSFDEPRDGLRALGWLPAKGS